METPPITYYALDLEKRELERTLSELATSDVGADIEGKVSTKGLCATYDDGLKFIKEGGLRQGLPTGGIQGYKIDNSCDDTSSPESSIISSVESSRSREVTPASTPDTNHIPTHILFLGSSIGNFARGDDASFLRSLPLRPGSGDTLLLGLDHDNGRQKIELAYNDPNGHTRDFIMNGLTAAGRFMGDEHLFDPEKWEYVGRYNEGKGIGFSDLFLHILNASIAARHEAYYKSKVTQTVIDPTSKIEFSFLKDELIQVEVSRKVRTPTYRSSELYQHFSQYSDEAVYALFSGANLRPVYRWVDSASQYSLWLLERPEFTFPLLASPAKTEGANMATSTPFGMPTVAEWQDMWAAWDFINQRMIPTPMLYEKPIDLRHICLFYQGHIPTFLDIHLSRLLGEPHTYPEEYKVS